MRVIKNFLKQNREYFETCKDSITAQNNRMLVDACVIYAGVLAFYTILTLLTDQPAHLRRMYYIFDIVHLVLCAAVFTRPALWKQSFTRTRAYCILLELTVLSFFALEGATASSTQHSLYVPIAILLLQLLFIHKTLWANAMTALYVTAFALLSCTHKTPAAYTNDIYIAIATFISASVGYVLITRMRQSEGAALLKYENLSKMDMLTGLYNKNTIEAVCRRAILQGNPASALWMIDLDNFKGVNDRYGHEVGDEVLEKVGAALKDTFSQACRIGRFGGDEFIVWMDSCDVATARDRANALQQKIAALEFSRPELRVRCSAGVALRRQNDDFRTLLQRADDALYTAKSNGKGRYCIAGEQIQAAP